ncbi:MAG: metallophosphoesterase [Gammaproteobacteria bacterium]|nr:metallophosphoesterase [Gammaproteobacteria bacterium]
MLKLLHISDLHNHKPYFDWILNQSGNYDALCITGDFIGATELITVFEPLEQQIEFVTSWLEALTKPTFICSGNHDDDIDNRALILEDDEFNFDSSIDDHADDNWYVDDILSEPSETWLTKINNPYVFSDNQIHKLQGIKFGMVPYAYEGSLSRFYDCDVLLHHEPPAKTETSCDKNGDWGNQDLKIVLANKIIQPKIVLSGHVHKPKKRQTKIHQTTIYNPGTDFKRQIPLHHLICV